MSSQREKRKVILRNQSDPINVTVIEDGIRKVIPFEEYKENYLDKAEEGVADKDGP